MCCYDDYVGMSEKVGIAVDTCLAYFDYYNVCIY